MNDEKKKPLIKETITGRKLTPGSIARIIGIFAACGAAFGLCAALTFCGARALGDASSQNAEVKKAQSAAEDHTEEYSGDEKDVKNEKSQNESLEEGGDSNETGSENTVISESEAAEAGETDENDKTYDREEAQEESDEKSQDVYKSITRQKKQAAEKAKKHLVSITGTYTGTTWFDSIASSSQNYAGVILSIGSDEILILTTADAAKAETFKVSFGSGTAVDAYVKQFSEKDDLAVLAVSAKNGMDEVILNELESIKFAGIRDIDNGESVIAIGAPLGTIGSYSFGDIGYICEGEESFDVTQNVFYAEVNADVSRGTFIVDYDGHLLGIAAEGGEGSASGKSLARIVSGTSLLGTINNLKQGNKIAYAGIKGTEVTFDMRYSGIPDGIYITDVDHGSAAYIAGIMRGDIVSEINGQAVTAMDEISRVIRKCEPGQQIKLKVMRSGSNGGYSSIDFNLVLGER